MYIQLTTGCNMRCAHCAMSAKFGKGEYMPTNVYEAALRLAAEMGEHITLGGGEPTMHPDFFKYLDTAIEHYRRDAFEVPPMVITNGKAKTKALKLFRYTRRDPEFGYFLDGKVWGNLTEAEQDEIWTMEWYSDKPGVNVELSQDEYHDPIDPEVVRVYTQAQAKQDKVTRYSYGDRSEHDPELFAAGTRTVTRIMAVGRGKDLPGAFDSCACDTMLVDPNGDIWACGCKTHKIGHVFDDLSFMDWYNPSYAHQGGRDPDDEQEETLDSEVELA